MPPMRSTACPSDLSAASMASIVSARVELGGVFFAVPLAQIVVAEVVGEPDAHGYR